MSGSMWRATSIVISGIAVLMLGADISGAQSITQNTPAQGGHAPYRGGVPESGPNILPPPNGLPPASYINPNPYNGPTIGPARSQIPPSNPQIVGGSLEMAGNMNGLAGATANATEGLAVRGGARALAREAGGWGSVTGGLGRSLTGAQIVVGVANGDWQGVQETGAALALEEGGCAAASYTGPAAGPALCGAWSGGLTIGSMVKDTPAGQWVGNQMLNGASWLFLKSDDDIMRQAEDRQRQADYARQLSRIQSNADQQYTVVSSELTARQQQADAEQAARIQAQNDAQAQQQSSSDGAGFMGLLNTALGATLQAAGNANMSRPASGDSSGASCTQRTFNTPDGCHPGHDESSHPGGCHCG